MLRVPKYVALFVLMSLLPALAAAQTEFRRDFKMSAFVPEGQWITGVSVSYSQSDEDNYKFLIVENLDGSSYNFKVSPMLFYTVRDNVALGGRLAYSRQQSKLGKGMVKIDSDTDYSIDNLYSVSQSYAAMAAMRDYISFGDNTRFGMFAELQLQLAGGQSKISNGSGRDFTGTYSRNFSLDVGVAPGLVMFLNNYSAIEVNVGLLGFSYNHSKATTDRIYVARQNSQYANFKVNLFSITFGVAFYL